MKPIIKYYPSSAIKSEGYWVDGKRHRLDGPAAIWYYESSAIEIEYYYVDGKCHRLEGPAGIWYHESGAIKAEYYWVNDNDITEQVIDWIAQGNDINDKVLFKLTFG